MIRRDLKIGRWNVEFYFAVDGYDSDELFERLFDLGAGSKTMNRALDLMNDGKTNTGFTFTNQYDHVALVAIGPVSSSKEFINTLTHEVYHLAVAIASELGVDLEGESPAYLVGDSMNELADVICRLGCPSCN